MERLNLNLPAEARERLRTLARGASRREAEYARELLLRAIEAEEREDFAREMDAATTPALRERLRTIAGAMEKLRGPTR